jgi:hypothetical protein
MLSRAHLIQERIKAQARRPEADNGLRRAQVTMIIAAHGHLEAGPQDFDGP